MTFKPSILFLTLLVLTVPASLGDAQADAFKDLTVEIMIKSDGMSDYYKAQEAQQNGKFSEAIKWYRIAVKKKNPLAQYALGYSYVKGRGVPKDNSKAVKWYRRAAKQEVPAAQKGLAMLYADGQGVRRDRVKALMWLNIAEIRGRHKDVSDKTFLSSAFLAKRFLSKEMDIVSRAEAKIRTKICLSSFYLWCG